MPDTTEKPGLIEHLRELLAEERRALLSGNPDLIMQVVQRKLAAAEVLERAAAMPVSLELLAALDRYNRENAIICGTMLRHLTDALDTLRHHSGLHRSYRLDGSEEHATSAPQTLGAA